MKYDANKSYTWSPDETFNITGREFGMLLNTIRAILGTEEANRILMLDRANQILEKVMAEGVESDKIVESVPPTIEEHKTKEDG